MQVFEDIKEDMPQFSVSLKDSQRPTSEFMASALNEMQVFEDIKEDMPQFSVSLKDIKRPTSEFVICYWLEVLKQFGVDVNRFKQQSIIERNTVSNVDGHMMFVMKLFKCLDFIFCKCGTVDFTVYDLLQPNPSRFWMHIGIMRNFCFFRNGRAEKLNEVKQSALNMKDNYKKLLIKCNELKEKCNQKARDQAEKPVYLKKLNDEVNATSSRILKLQEEINELKEVAAEHKDHLIEQDKKIIKLKTDAQKYEEQISELRLQLVSSPENLFLNLEELEAKEQDLKVQCSSVDEGSSKRRDSEKKFERHIVNINNSIEELEKCLAVLKDNSNLKKKVEVSKRQMEELEEKLFYQNRTLSVCETAVDQLRQDISECQKSKSLLMTTSQQKVQDLNMTLENLKVETEEYVNKVKDVEPELKELHTSLEEQEAKLSQLRTDDSYLVSRYEELLKEIEDVKLIEDDDSEE